MNGSKQRRIINQSWNCLCSYCNVRDTSGTKFGNNMEHFKRWAGKPKLQTIPFKCPPPHPGSLWRDSIGSTYCQHLKFTGQQWPNITPMLNLYCPAMAQHQTSLIPNKTRLTREVYWRALAQHQANPKCLLCVPLFTHFWSISC